MGIPEEGGLLFSGGSVVKESACQFRGCRKHRFDPGAGKILWRRKWQPTSVLTEQPAGYRPQGQRAGRNWVHTQEKKGRRERRVYLKKQELRPGEATGYTSPLSQENTQLPQCTKTFSKTNHIKTEKRSMTKKRILKSSRGKRMVTYH